MRERRVISVAQPRTFHQLGILVLDGSGSMEELTKSKITKGEEVSGAVKNLFSRFKASNLRSNFSFAIVCYDYDGILSLDISKTSDINVNHDYNPLNETTQGATSIHSGLKIANEIANKFLNDDEEGGVPHKVLIMLMSDGLDMTIDESRAIAEEIKKNPKIQIACSFLETLGGNDEYMKQGAEFLKEICSEPTLYEDTQDAEGLRSFFERSMSAAAGKNIFS